MTKKKLRPSKHGRQREDGWYEVVNMSKDGKRITNVQDAEGYRYFISGKIKDALVIQVPETMPIDRRNRLGQSLSAQGISVLIVDETLQFCRLRRVSPKEEMLLTSYVSQEPDAAADTSPDGSADASAENLSLGSLFDGDGAESSSIGRNIAESDNPETSEATQGREPDYVAARSDSEGSSEFST